LSRVLTWIAGGALAIALTVLALCPASWVAGPLQTLTSGRITLLDADGSVWHGSAWIAAAADGDATVTPLLPGRVTWRLSPMALAGRIDAEVESAGTLSEPVRITGSWSRWQVSPAAMTVPAERLAALGAPFNTIRPAGVIRVSWGPLELSRADGAARIQGTFVAELQDLSSRLSAIKPVGAYRLTIRCEGSESRMALETIRGPLLLAGTGGVMDGHWRFAGHAEAVPGSERDLANFMNLLGESRREGDKTVIALNFQ
jgi:general secretion pathway protein N